ncbi:hypothetical protein [Granulicella aggregans]|uniref:hypothetical protein n=1 Tax=Granulicella aggregans TaxID=474949 RepID=UPI0021E0E2C3|nr:hypothetical protein [Granulicella aggregans]
MKGSFIVFGVLSVALGATSSLGQERKKQTVPLPASPQAVCTFITSQMTSMVPQAPTLCSGERSEVAGYYEISVVSPTDALEGNLRRAWSSALFQTFEHLVDEPSLKGACKTDIICDTKISDTSMSRESLDYQIFLTQNFVEHVQLAGHAFHAPSLSERWYLLWWDALMVGKESDNNSSAAAARSVGERACQDYMDAEAKRTDTKWGTGPQCFVMLATEKNLYLTLNFPTLVSALVDRSDIVSVLGRALSSASYDGAVVVRSPYLDTTSGKERVFKIYPIRGLQFAYDEQQSGMRSLAEATLLLEERYRGYGQTTEYSLSNAGNSSIWIRTAAVFEFPHGKVDRTTVDLTDGTEWKLSDESKARCGVVLGSEITTFGVIDKAPILTVDSKGQSCSLDAMFLRGW